MGSLLVISCDQISLTIDRDEFAGVRMCPLCNQYLLINQICRLTKVQFAPPPRTLLCMCLQMFLLHAFFTHSSDGNGTPMLFISIHKMS